MPDQDGEVRNVLFVSYAREDRATCEQIVEFISQSAGDAGYEVWWDQSLQAGRSWNEQIERQLSRARAAIILVSIDALRSEFIWEREIRPLREAGVPVAPLLIRACPWTSKADLASSQFLDPPGAEIALHDLDPSVREQVLTKIAGGLRGWLPDLAAAQTPPAQTPPAQSRSALGPGGLRMDPLSRATRDKARIYEELDTARFTGRRQLIADIDEFIGTHQHGWVIVEGEAGVGKSALAAHLVWSRAWFYHFARLSRNPESVRKSLAAQLVSRFGLEGPAPGDASPDYLRDVLNAAADSRDLGREPGQPIVLVIDGLDEFDPERASDTPLGLPAAAALPRGVFVLVTRRPGRTLPSPGQPALWKRIDIDGVNDQDMRDYLSGVLSGPGPDPDLLEQLSARGVAPAAFADMLMTRCAGVWIYLRYVLENVRNGSRDPADVVSLPPELREYYLQEIGKWCAVDDRKRRHRLLTLAMLAALRRPADAGELADLAGIAGDDDRDELRRWLNTDIRAFLVARRPDGDDQRRYRIRHQSLRDVITAPDQPDREADGGLADELRDALRKAHVAIAARLTPPGRPGQRDWAGADEYVRGELAEHAEKAGVLDELVADPGFLLICQPSSVLSRRRYLKTTSGILAVSAYEAALGEWAVLAGERERVWRLHVWASKTRASLLAARCGEIAGRTPVIKAAVWTGKTHPAVHAHVGSVWAITALPVPGGHPLLASGGSDGLVQLLDPVTGTAEGRSPDGHDGWVTAVAAVPERKASLLATGSSDGTVRLWNPDTGLPACDPIAAHQGSVTAIVTVMLADDHAVLATAGSDGMVRLWDPATGQRVRELPAGRGDLVMTAVPVPGRPLLATGDKDGVVLLWDPVTGRAAAEPLTGQPGPVNALAAAVLDPGRVVLAIAGRDGVVLLPDPETGRAAAEPLTGQPGPVNALAAAELAGRPLILAGGQDHTVRSWDPATGEAALPPLEVHARRVNAVAAVPLPDGRTMIATGGADGKIELQELREPRAGGPAVVPPAGFDGPVNALAVAELKGRPALVTGSGDRTVRLWDPVTGEPVPPPISGHQRSVVMVTALPLPGGRTLIAACDTGGAVRLWDPAESGAAARRMKRCPSVHAIAAVELPGRTLLVTGGADGMVRLWDPVTGEPAGDPMAGHDGPVNAIAVTRLPGGRTLLATGGSDGTVWLWDPAACAAADDSLIGYQGPVVGYGGRIRTVTAVQLPGGRTRLAFGGDYGVVELWEDRETRVKVIEPTANGAPVNSIVAVELPDGRTLLATAVDYGTVRLWDPVTGEPAGGPLVGHVGPVKSMVTARLPDGSTVLATGGSDKTVLIWGFSDVP